MGREAGVTGLVVILLGVSAWMTAAMPTAGYFSLASRAWELAVGVLAALLVQRGADRLDRFRIDLAYIGLGLIVLSALWIDAGSGFPFPWAIPAVVGSALVVWSGERGNGPAVLDNPPMRYLGDRSYSIYLWHFPAIAMVQQMRLDDRMLNLAAPVVLTFVLAELSYRLVEKPLRAIGHHERPRWDRDRVAWAGIGVGATAVVAVMVLLVHAAAIKPLPVLEAQQVADLWSEPAGPAAQARAEAIDAALVATAWDDRQAVLESAVYVDHYRQCLGDWGEDGARAQIADDACWYGDPDGDRLIYVAGDSNALAFVPVVVAAYPDARVRALTTVQCPLIAVGTATFAHDKDPADCAASAATFIAEIARVRPDAVVLVSASTTMWRLASGATGEAAQEEWRAGFESTLSEIAPLTGDVIVLDSLRQSVPVAECAWRLSRPGDCAAAIGGVNLEVPRVQREVTDRLGLTNVHYPRTLQWYCNADGLCPAAIDNVAVAVDTEHLSLPGATALGPLLRAAVPLGEQ